MTLSTKRFRIWALLAVFVVLLPGAAQAAAPLRVLLLSGSNNHDWKTTTPMLVKVLEGSGAFTVKVTENPASCSSDTLKDCDVVVSNWNNFPSQERAWGPAFEKALLDFVKAGKGFVVVHAASACLPTWKEFQQLVGATWGKKTGHGDYHKFPVTAVEPEHPVTRGLKGFTIVDELWHRMPKQPSAQVLCRAWSAPEQRGTGANEPVVFANQFGQGRCFNLVLGHDVAAMENVGWRLLMLRGTQWAATGKATIEIPLKIRPELKRVAGFQRGQDTQVFATIDQLVQLANGYECLRNTLAAEMAAMLSDDDVTNDCKKYLLGQLSQIGTASEVSALAALLNHSELGNAARFALERMGDKAALAALRAALSTLKGKPLIGVINTLGELRDRQAVSPLEQYVASTEPAVPSAAIVALGKIGGPEAVKVLERTKSDLAASLQAKRGQALLLCAESLIAQGDRPAARKIYLNLKAADEPWPVRRAALIGLVGSALPDDQVKKYVTEALAGDDSALQLAAVQCLQVIDSQALRLEVADLLSTLPVSLQRPVVAALAETGDRSLLGPITRLITVQDTMLRTTVVEAMGRLGDASTVAVLARQLDSAKNAELEAVRQSLTRLSGTGVNQAVLSALAKATDVQVKRELIRVLASRQAGESLPVLLQLLAGANSDLRLEASEAIGSLGDAEVYPALIKALAQSDSAQEQRVHPQSLIAIARRSPDLNKITEQISQAMTQADAPMRELLVNVLRKIGGPDVLDLVRKALRDIDENVRLAALRALSSTGNSAVLEDLLGVAQAPDNPRCKILALRGFAEAYQKAHDLGQKQSDQMAAKALALADRPEEKLLLLSALAAHPSAANLNLAMSMIEQPAMQMAAVSAATKIAKFMAPKEPEVAKATYKKILSSVSKVDVQQRVRALLFKLEKPKNLALAGTASSPDGLGPDGFAGNDQAGIDGDPATYWDEVDHQPLYRYRVTLPQQKTISSLGIMGVRHQDYAPKDFKVLCDGKVVTTVRDAAYEDNFVVVTFAPTACKVIELEITGRYGRSPAIRELELYAASENDN